MDNATSLDNITVCRFCLQNTGDISVFSSSESSGNSTYCDQAMCIANVKIEVGDGLPSTVCRPCVLLLRSSFTFKLLVESSALKLSLRALEQIQPGDGIKKEEPVSDNEGEAFRSSDCGDGAEEKFDTDQGWEESAEPLKRLAKCEKCSKKFTSAHRRRSHSKICSRRTVVPATFSEGGCDIKTEEADIQEDFKVEPKNDLIGLAERDPTLELLGSCPVLERGIAKGFQQLLAKTECQNCKKHFSSGRGLNIHLAKCTGRRRRKKNGDLINGSTDRSNIGAFVKNVDRNSLKENERRHMCECCGRAFTSRSVLRQHARTHDAPRAAHPCPLCGKLFTRVAHLVAHRRIHDNVKPYICETCGRGFTKSSDLYRHRRVHSDSRAFPCTLCGKLFKRSGDVVVHMRAHTGNRPFQCALCDKNYKSHSSLKKHKKHHAGELAGNGDNEQAPMNMSVLCDSRKEISSPEKHESTTS